MVLTVLLAVLPAVGRADLPSAVNAARSQGCVGSARVPLRDSAKLRQAAQQVANGVPLKAALASSGFQASRAASIHVSGAQSDAELRKLLSASNCTALTDPNLTDMGVQRRGREIWIVLAAEVRLPSLRDAPLIRQQILDLVNNVRRSGRRCGSRTFAAAAPLTLSAELTSAALTHSQEMAAYGEFDHRGHDGSSPAARVAGAGYGRFALVGENIAAGLMTPQEVMQGWLDSPGHCENIMDPRFSEIGIAFAVSPSSSELVYWTQDFAEPRRLRAGPASSR